MLHSDVSIIKLRANMHIATRVKTLTSSNGDRKKSLLLVSCLSNSKAEFRRN